MWTPDPGKLVKVRLHDQGQDTETPWAEDLGPADPSAAPGARRVRIGNVPFLHTKPTYEDVVVATPDEGGMLSWCVGEPIEEDAGRWAMILDYEPRDPELGAQAAFSALDRAAEAADITAEGCYGPRPGRPGRVYFAVPNARSVDDAVAYFEGANLGLNLTLIHPVDDEDDDASS